VVDLYTSCTNGNRKNALSGNYKICNFTTIVSLHYLRKFKNTHNCTFWNQLSVYFNAQRHQRQERVQVNCFQFLLGNSLNSLLAENLLHSHRFLIKILSLKLNIRSIIHLHSKLSWRAMWRNYGRHNRWGTTKLVNHSVEYSFHFTLVHKVLKSIKKRRSYSPK